MLINKLNERLNHNFKEFDEVFTTLTYNSSFHTVFNDFLDLCINHYSNSKHTIKFNKENKDYTENDYKSFKQLYHLWIETSMEYINNGLWFDYLGTYLELKEQTNQKSNAQYFTPIHIADLMSELINSKGDIYDSCCGTSRLLLSKAFNKKGINVQGIDLDKTACKISTLNLLIHNINGTIIHGDSSKKEYYTIYEINNQTIKIKNTIPQYTFNTCLINPPYSLSKNKETKHLSELNFIKRALYTLNKNGECTVIVPQSTMVGKTKEDKLIKKELLKYHTLEGVITLNGNTVFYNANVNPVIAIFTAHQPHPEHKKVKFIDFKNDGYELKKHNGIIATKQSEERKEHLLQCWNEEIKDSTKFIVKSKIHDSDEWLHSFYYFNDEIPSEESFKETMIEYLTFEFEQCLKGRSYLFRENK